MKLALWGLVGFGLSVALTGVCKPLARRMGAVAFPKADRWHREPIPLLGGVAIFCAVFISLLFLPGVSRSVWVLLVSAFSLFALGMVDDFRPLKPQIKFISQILVASVLVAMNMQLRLTPYPLLNILLTLFWIVGITNAFNLLDNMDGLAAGIAAITAGFRLSFFLRDGNIEGATVTTIFIGAMLGFLVYNFQPARIFMGDAGSLFIGVFLSGLSLIGGYPYSRNVASVLLFPVLILLVPIFDTLFVMFTRGAANRPISVGGRDHTSHRLVALGLSERQAVMVLYLVAFVSGMVAYVCKRFGLSYNVLLIAFLGIGLAILGALLSRIRVYPEEEVTLPETGRFFRLVSNFTYKRQVATVFLDVLLIVLSYYSAYLLRFGGSLPQHEWSLFKSLPIIILCQLWALAMFQAYPGTWRYTNFRDLVRLSWGVTVGSASTVLAMVYAYRFVGYSRMVFALDWVLLLVSVTGSRLAINTLSKHFLPIPQEFKRILIYGAGDGGELACREILENPKLRRTPVGFIDDDLSKIQTQIFGLPVLGGANQLEEIIRKHSIAEVVVASSKIPEENVRRISAVCEPLSVSVVRASLRLE